MEEAMGITLIVFVLIILSFGLDSTGQVKTRQQRNSPRWVFTAGHMMLWSAFTMRRPT